MISKVQNHQISFAGTNLIKTMENGTKINREYPQIEAIEWLDKFRQNITTKPPKLLEASPNGDLITMQSEKGSITYAKGNDNQCIYINSKKEKDRFIAAKDSLPENNDTESMSLKYLFNDLVTIIKKSANLE